MKKHLLTMVLCAFALSISPNVSAAPATLEAEELLLFKKNKKKQVSKARHKKLKRNSVSFARKINAPKRKSIY